MAQELSRDALLDMLETGRRPCVRVPCVARIVDNRIDEFRKKHGWSWEKLGKSIRPPHDQATVYRIANGTSPLTTEWMERFAEAFGLEDPLQLLRNAPSSKAMIPLVGYVGAGEMYYPDPEAGAWSPIGEVEGPPGAEGVVAVRVRGDSMAPVYRSGDLVYFRRNVTHDEHEVINKDCVVQVHDGPCYIKRVEKDRATKGRYKLSSYAGVDPIDGVRADWIAPVEWVKRG